MLKQVQDYNTHISTVFQSKELCKIQYEQNVDMTILVMAEEI